MSSFSAPLETAIQQPFIRMFNAVQVIFPDYTIQLMDGSGFITFGGLTFTGSDPIYGTISDISTIASAFATQAPSVDVTFMPPSTSGIVGLNNPLYQLAPVTFWIGVVNEQTGQVIGSYKHFSGAFDYSKSSFSAATQTIQMHVVSVLDKMFVAEEGARLNAQFHKLRYPTETGLDLNIQALVAPFWGQTASANPKYPTLPTPPTLGDRLSGQNGGGTTYGNTYPGF